MAFPTTRRSRRQDHSPRREGRLGLRRRHVLDFEQCEERTLLSVTASLVQSGVATQLQVDDTSNGQNVINVGIAQNNANDIEVDDNGAPVGVFPLSSVQSILVDTYAASDTVNINDPNGEFLNIPMTLRAVSGNDTFNPGYGTTVLDGGTGSSNLGLPTQLVLSVGTALSNELTKLQASLDSAAYGADSLPFIGSQLKSIPDAQIFADFQSQLSTALNEVANPPDIQQLIYDVLGPNQVAINGSTAGTGLGLLGDTNGDGTTNISDVVITETKTLSSASYTVETALTKALTTETLPLSLQIGLPNLPLNLTTTGNLQAQVAFNADLDLGVSLINGAPQVGLVTTNALSSTPNTATITADLSLSPNFSATGTLGFVHVTAAQHPGGTSSFDPSIAVHLSDTSASATVTGEAKLDLDLAIDVGESDAGIDPTLTTEFQLDWMFNGDNLADAESSFKAAPTVSFNNVSLDLGSFVSSFAAPILGKIQSYLAPLQPVVNELQQPLPGLRKLSSSLDINVTLETLIDAVDPTEGKVLDAFISVYDELEDMTFAVGKDVQINFGSFSPAAPVSGNDTANVTQSPPSTPANQATSGESSPKGSDDFLSSLFSSANTALSFPFLENPANVFALLLGQTETLATVTLPTLTIQAAVSQSFPIFEGLVGLVVGGGVGLTAKLAFGYDTTGIQEMDADTGATTPQKVADLLDGFYISNRQDSKGNPVADPEPGDGSTPGPQFILNANLSVGLELGPDEDGYEVDASITGTLDLDAYFTLHDSSGTGRIRYKALEADIENAVNSLGSDPATALNYIFDTTVDLVGSVIFAVNVDFADISVYNYSDTIAQDTIYSFSTGTIGGVDPSNGLLLIAPTAELEVPSTSLEGSTQIPVVVTGINNPNPQDGLDYTFNFYQINSDGTSVPLYSGADDTFSDSAPNANPIPDQKTSFAVDDGPASILVDVQVEDDTTQLSTDYSAFVSVQNVAPTSGLVNNGPVVLGQSAQVAFSNTGYAPLPNLYGTGEGITSGNPPDPHYTASINGDTPTTTVVYNPGTSFQVPGGNGAVIGGSSTAEWIGGGVPVGFIGSSSTATIFSTTFNIDPANLPTATINININTVSYGLSGADKNGYYDYEGQPQYEGLFINDNFVEDVPMYSQGIATFSGGATEYGFMHADVVSLTPAMLAALNTSGTNGQFKVDVSVQAGIDPGYGIEPVQVFAKIGLSGTYAPPYTSDPSMADTAAGFTYSYDFNDDGSFTDPVDPAPSSSPAAIVPASVLDTLGPHIIHGRVTDKDGGYNDYYTVIDVVSGPSPEPLVVLQAGQSLTLGSSGTAIPYITYAWDIYGPTPYHTVTNTPGLTLPWFLIKTDNLLSDAGSNGSATFGYAMTPIVEGYAESPISGEIVLLDTPPTATLSGSSAVAAQTYTLGFKVSDPGVDQVSTWLVDWGDGTADEVTVNTFQNLVIQTPIFSTLGLSTSSLVASTDANGNLVYQYTATHVYAAPGQYDVTATGQYQIAGGATAGVPVQAGPLDVAVSDPSPPVAVIDGNLNGPFLAGDSTVTVSDDPADEAPGLSYLWKVFPQPSNTPVAEGASPNLSFVPPAAGPYTVQLTVTDQFGQSTVASREFGVSPNYTTLVLASGSGTYGGTGTLTATLTADGQTVAGQLVTFSLPGFTATATTNAEGVATIAGVSMQQFGAGVHANFVSVSYEGVGGYGPSNANGSLTIAKADLTVTADNESTDYGTAATLGYSLSGFVNGDSLGSAHVTGSPTLSTIATAATPVASTPFVINVGLGTLSSQNYAFTTFDPGLLVILPAPLTIAAANQTMTYGGPMPALTATYTGFVNGDTASSLTNPPILTTTATSASDRGAYPIIPAGASDPNYTISYVDGTLNVTPAPLTVTVNNATRTYGAANPIFSGTIAGVVNNDVILSGYTTSASATSGVGSYPIVPNFNGTNVVTLSNYSVTLVDGTLSVTQAPLTVTANNATRTYGAANPTFSGTVTGVLNNDAILTNFTTSATPTSNAGSYSIVPNFNGTNLATLSNYSVTFVDGTLSVTQAPLTVTANNATRSYGAANPTFSGTVTGVLNNDAILTSFTTIATPTSNVGSYSIVPNFNGTNVATLSNYSVTLVDGTLSVTQAPLTVTANNATRSYGAANPTFSGTVTGVLNNDAILTSFTTNATPTSNAGSYSIVPNFNGTNVATLSNYSVTLVDGTLSVTQAPLTVTANNATRTYGAANPTLSGTVTGVLNNDAILTGFTTNATPNSSAGSYSIVPNFNGTNVVTLSNYSVTLVNGTLSVTPAPLTVTANNATRTYGAANPTLTYSLTGFVLNQTQATSDVTGAPVLSVSATASSPVGAYAISVGKGTLASTDYTFNAVAGTLSVAKGTPTITLSAPNSTYNGAPYNAAAAEVYAPTGANVGPAALTYYAGSDTALASPSTGAPTVAGSYQVVASYAGDFNDTPTATSPAAFTIAQRATTTTVALSSSAPAPGQPLTVTATVGTGLATLFVPAGETVQFTLDGAPVGAPVPLGADGTASYTLTTPPTGTHTFGAIYSGDANFTGSTAAAASETTLGSGVYVIGTTLYIIGSNNSDDVAVGPWGNRWDGSTGLAVVGTINGHWLAEAFTQTFTAIVIYGYNGSDGFLLAPTLTLATTVVEGDGNDYLLTAAGNDVITMGNGCDVVQGGTGNKTVTVGNGNDSVQYCDGNHTVTLGNGNNNVTLGDGTDTITLGSGCNSVVLGDGNKTVTGTTGTGNDYVSAGTGTDTVTLGNGNDSVELGGGANTVTLGNGNDYVSACDGDNTVTVGNGNDSVQLGDGNNVVVEGNGTDSVSAGNGANLVVGGLGQHTIRLGNGNNILIDGSATVTNSGDSFRQILTDWNASGSASVDTRLTVIYNTTHPNTLSAGHGRHWFFFTNSKDSTSWRSGVKLN